MPIDASESLDPGSVTRTLLGSENLAPEGNLYPVVEWMWKLKSVTKDE